MAFCANCGKELPDGAKFCGFCGAPQPQAGVPKVTPEKVYREENPKKKGKKTIGVIIALCAAAVIAGVFFFMHSGWSTEDAHNATQAYLDYGFFKGDDEELAKYMLDATAEELSEQRENRRDDMIEVYFESDVPVTQGLKTRYRDFLIETMKKAQYTVGEAVKTDDGFEVPVTIEPITSLAHGDFVLLDMQLNEELSNADLNERVYTRELELMTQLMQNPAYGDPQEIIIHITKGEDGYVFSEDDEQKILDLYLQRDRHWTKERAEKAVEAVLGGVYCEKYAEMSEWTVATQEEIEEVLGAVFSKEAEKEMIENNSKEIIDEWGADITYEVSDELAQTVSDTEKALLAGTKYEVVSVDGDQDIYTVTVRITPYDTTSFDDGYIKRLEKEAETITDPGKLLDRIWEVSVEMARDLIEDAPYGEPIERQLHLTYNNNRSYEMDYEEINALYDIYGDELGAMGNEEASGSEVEGSGESAAADEKDNESNGSEEGSDDSMTEPAAGTFTDGKDIPVIVGGLKIELGKTTLQDVLDKTGYTIIESDKVIPPDELDSIEIDTGNSDVYFDVFVENFSSKEEKKASECPIYGISFSDYSDTEKDMARTMSVGGITAGSKKEDVIAAFGAPETTDEEYISYLLNDGKYTIFFGLQGNTVNYIDISEYDF